MKTFQFTNKHGKQVHVAEEQAIFLYGNQSLRFDGEVIPTTKKEAVKNEDGSYKMTGGHYVKNKDGSFKKNNKGEYVIAGQEYVYEDKKTFKLDPESIPKSQKEDYENKGNRIELKSSLVGGSEKPQSKFFKNKKSIK